MKALFKLILVIVLSWGQGAQAQKAIIIPPDYNPANNQCGTLSLVSGYNYTGTNVTDTQVKNALSESTTSISALCSSTKINKWAAFKPGSWGPLTDCPAGVFSWIPPTNGYRLGDFIGYNSNAKPPVYYSTVLPTTLNVERWDTPLIQIYLARGEANPVQAGASKTAVDVQTVFNGVTTMHKGSIPTSGSFLTAVNVNVDANTTLSVNPYYYVDEGQGNYNYVSMIEDGARTINLVISALQMTGSMSGIPPNQTGNSTINANISYTITRTAASVKNNIYSRISVRGVGITSSDNTIGTLSFAANEVKIGTINFDINATTNSTTTVYFYLEVSNTYDFASYVTLDSRNFRWTTPLGGV